ncbi:MAG: folate-binding protein [Gallionellaceae bacterium]|jgi:hypothetical protein
MHNSDWQTFLESEGAHIQNEVVQDFGDAAAERIATRDATVLCDLSQFGLLKVSGEDAQSFLQNMCSNDIKLVTPQRAQLSSFNTAKGRVLATFIIRQEGADYFLHLPHALLASIHKKFSMYVLRSKVKIENVSAHYVCLGMAGEGAAALLKKTSGEIPQDIPWVAVPSESGSLIRVANNTFIISALQDCAAGLWRQLGAFSKPVGSPCWDWLLIRAGIPLVLPATQEQYVLQMLNLDILEAVSFKKGCYPGQEIVARLHYLGKVKQRTYLAHIDSDMAPQPHDDLFSEDYAGQASGSILNAAPAPQGGFDVLATLHVSTLSAACAVHWKALDGAVLSFAALPYALPESAG